MNVNAFEQDIFRVTTGLAIHASLARTLACCLYSSQHATHWDGDVPAIWKTGPELCAELRIAARTANRHFKELAALGYWDQLSTSSGLNRQGHVIDYGYAFSRSRRLGAAAGCCEGEWKEPERNIKRYYPEHAGCRIYCRSIAHDVTSKQVHQSAKIAKREGFILPSEAGKKRMKETCYLGTFGKRWQGNTEGASYVKACAADHAFAAIVREA